LRTLGEGTAVAASAKSRLENVVTDDERARRASAEANKLAVERLVKLVNEIIAQGALPTL
jgi:uncharacterized membrane protein